MNVLKKIIIITISIAIIIFIALIIVLWAVRGDILFIGYNKFLIAPSYNKTDEFLKSNINELSHVASELSKMNYDSITILNESMQEDDSYNMRVNLNDLVYETIPVPNELINYIKVLYKKGVQEISCGSDFVNFTLWSTMDESRGIMYSINNAKPNGEQLIKVSHLSKSNWYYYVHNYEKAKEQNPDFFE